MPSADALIKDSIIVPQGFSLKIEGASVTYKAINPLVQGGVVSRYLFGSFNTLSGTLMIDNFLVKNYLNNFVTYQTPEITTIWLGEGKHYVSLFLHAGSSTSLSYNAILSLNGLMFKVDP